MNQTAKIKTVKKLTGQAKLVSYFNKFWTHLINDRLDDPRALLEYNMKGGQFILEQFDPYISKNTLRDKVILDYGCGDGGKTLFFAGLAPKEIVGVDVAQGLYTFKCAKEYINETKILNARYDIIENGAIPLHDNSVDIIISTSVFEHISSPLEALLECYRVLKPGGIFALRWHPYHSKNGGHIQYVIGIPFAHIIFSEAALMKVFEFEIKNKFNKMPYALVNMNKFESLSDHIYLNKLYVKDFYRIVSGSKFEILARKYFREARERKIPRLIQNSKMLDYFVDYEIYFMTKQ